jgi:hypothetical protein
MSVARGGTYRPPCQRLKVEPHSDSETLLWPTGRSQIILTSLYLSANYTRQAVALLDLTSAEPHLTTLSIYESAYGLFQPGVST